MGLQIWVLLNSDHWSSLSAAAVQFSFMLSFLIVSLGIGGIKKQRAHFNTIRVLWKIEVTHVMD